ncbi:hypothetical protein LTR35_013885 [Friedmanniomyces endolithicus]|uniref:Ubiquitin-conjugating enzyme E2 Z n=1 Tax=Friedmanniomyces endolithicus TaxID=329885 RepID=A0AAN6J484_9PEZI|nr:hypothetical protein LTR35_013885 [Friedmanniomyces endolithicus]KAK0273943.1 hypothetical protein LTS00_015585 [Friedmanniomyces endolithicus]KAK0313293.1 hypothetical protein LTR82_013527 [Friedmanniomyces endolithicus]KAK0987855.1 hypothetical protein LTR54_012995 [Friedmanniomyces endolithicus]
MANTSGAIARITREIAQVQKNTDLSLAVAVRDSDVRHIRALIIGPPETPYEYGFFEFDVKMPKEYPIKSPQVRAITTNSGRTRFNPNIYNEGKVCLSILGTWRGDPGEEWSSAQGLESVLLSIQSLMSANPYENEPSFEKNKKEEPNPKAYIQKIQHETLRISVIQRLEGLLGIVKDSTSDCLHTSKRARIKGAFSPAAASKPESGYPNPNYKPPFHHSGSSGSDTPPLEDQDQSLSPASSVHEYDAEATFADLDEAQWDPFADLMKRRFLWYYDTYLCTIEQGIAQYPGGRTQFKRMEFEFPPNTMDGHFNYPLLRNRLIAIKTALDAEQKDWTAQGLRHIKESTQLSAQLAFQFTQSALKWNNNSSLEISLPDPANPFLWHLTLFGKPMTNLDGGIFQLTLAIPTTFPDAQPRVKFQTPIFHHRVGGTTGILVYFPKKDGEIAEHLVAIVESVEDEEETARFDPRAVVNPEAFELYWGGEEKRKVYGRRLRRSARESGEEVC